MNTLEFGLWCLCLVAFMYLVSFSEIYYHERAHQVIFEEYGYESSIELGFLSGSTIAVVPKSESAQMYSDHNFADTLTYTLYPFLMLLSIITFCVGYNTIERMIN